MNLYIKVDGNKLSVYQTPTFITNMCLATDQKGRINKHRAINAYCEYVRGRLGNSTTYKSAEEIEEHRQHLEEHIAEVQAAIKNCKKFEVYTI